MSSALARLSEGGRLVAITGHNVGPDQPAWRDSFVEMQHRGRVVFTSMIAGQAYARHGTTIETRLTVIDRVPAEDPRAFPPSPGMAADAAELLDQICRLMPPRQTVATPPPLPAPISPLRTPPAERPKAPQLALVNRPTPLPDIAELAYETREWRPGETRFTANLYESYALQSKVKAPTLPLRRACARGLLDWHGPPQGRFVHSIKGSARSSNRLRSLFGRVEGIDADTDIYWQSPDTFSKRT